VVHAVQVHGVVAPHRVQLGVHALLQNVSLGGGRRLSVHRGVVAGGRVLPRRSRRGAFLSRLARLALCLRLLAQRLLLGGELQHGAELGGARGALGLLLGVEQVDPGDELPSPRRFLLRLLPTHREHLLPRKQAVRPGQRLGAGGFVLRVEALGAFARLLALSLEDARVASGSLVLSLHLRAPIARGAAPEGLQGNGGGILAHLRVAVAHPDEEVERSTE
jgi:hypothetical protein